MKHVMIALPTYTGVVHIGTVHSLIDDLIALVNRGDRFTIVDDVGNSAIADCRGVIASNFYKSDCDMLVFVDNDVCWERGGLLRIIDHPVDLVAGVYPHRVDPLSWTVRWDQSKKELWADPETGLLEVECVATGFMKISRNCIAKMIEAHPSTWVHEKAVDGKFWPLFEPHLDVRKKHRYGEDYSFCMRWRELGEKVWIDPEIGMGHTGLKVFEGHIGNWLKSRIIPQPTSEVTHEPNQNS